MEQHMNKEREYINQVLCNVYDNDHLIPPSEADQISACLQQAWLAPAGDQIYPYRPFLNPLELCEAGGEIYEQMRSGSIHMAVTKVDIDVAAIASLVRKNGKIPELGRVAANKQYVGNGYATRAVKTCLEIAERVDRMPVFIGISANRSIMESVLVNAAAKSGHKLTVLGLSPNCYKVQNEVSGNAYEWSEVDWIAFHEPLPPIPLSEEISEPVANMVYRLVLRSKGSLQIEGANQTSGSSGHESIEDPLALIDVKNAKKLQSLIDQGYYPVGIFPLVSEDKRLVWHVKMYHGRLPKLNYERQNAIAPGQSPVYVSKLESYRAMSLIWGGNNG
jgi:hypothetical protein